MKLADAMKREALRALDGPTLFQIALALAKETRQQAAKRLGITSSAVSMYLGPPEHSSKAKRDRGERHHRRITDELAAKVEKLYGIPASAWKP